MNRNFFLYDFFGEQQKIVELEVFFLWLFLCAQNSGVLEVLFLWFFLSARKSGESQFFFV